MAINFEKAFLRVLDANTNRLKEGLRVIEDITRFLKEDKKLTGELKKARHNIDFYIKKISPDYKKQLMSRKSEKDIGKSIKIKSEYKRKDFKEILISNFKRVQESLRVLEEISKIKDEEISKSFKKMRFKIYELEKNFFREIINF